MADVRSRKLRRCADCGRTIARCKCHFSTTLFPICPRCKVPITELPDVWAQYLTAWDLGERASGLQLAHLKCAAGLGYHAVDLARDLDLRIEVRKRFPSASKVFAQIDELTKPLPG